MKILLYSLVTRFLIKTKDTEGTNPDMINGHLTSSLILNLLIVTSSFEFPWYTLFSELYSTLASVINDELTHISSLVCED